MATDPNVSAMLTGAAISTALWVLDKVAGCYVENRANKIICAEPDNGPAADRLARTLSALEAEHQSLKATTLAVIAQRDHYLNLYLAAQRELRQGNTLNQPASDALPG